MLSPPPSAETLCTTPFGGRNGWLAQPGRARRGAGLATGGPERDEQRRPRGRRASDRGFLPLSLAEYLKLGRLDGKAIAAGQARRHPRPMRRRSCERLGLSGDGWLWGIESFGRLFRSAIGRATALADFAASRGRRWLHGVSAARLAFG